MNIGILGGTFDPIHKGHLAIADHVLKKLHLDHIEIIPCYHPPHRDQPIASAENRLQMARLAVQDHPKLKVNACEIERKKISYTVDTLSLLQAQFPSNTYYLILGADAFAQFDTWHDWETIIKMAHLVVVSRNNQEIETPVRVADFIKKTASEHKIHFCTIMPIPISATQIRAALHEKKQEISALPTSVYEYILSKHIY